MKLQILSLTILFAAIAAGVSAKANSDVPDNMLSARSAVDILTNNEVAQVLGPYDECTTDELKNGTCVKTIYPNMMLSNQIPAPAGMKLQVTIQSERCYNQMEMTLPNQYRQRIFARETYTEAGRYNLNNSSANTCDVLYELVK